MAKKVVPDEEVGYDFMLSVVMGAFSITLRISFASLQGKIWFGKKMNEF